jgi:peptide deformylase
MPFPASKLTIHPAEILRQKTEKIVDFDEDLQRMVGEMITIMHESDGVGLAAPQAGHSVQVFVCNAREDGEEDMVFINPEIMETAGAQEWAEEGCLSLPNIHGRVRRPTYVRIRAQDLTGATFEVESETFHARIWQHEYDHLQGVLILDRMRPIDRLAARRAIKDLVGR